MSIPSSQKTNTGTLLLLSVSLPPAALDLLGPLEDERVLDTPYGTIGPIGLRRPAPDHELWVEPYSGAPGRTDPRATIIAAAQLGLRQILAWDSAIAVNANLTRGQVAIVTDYIDWTRTSIATFAGADTSVEQIANVARRPTFCPRMTQALRDTIPHASDIVYLAVDGPRRETAAEARMYRTWGADALGQNLAPEVTLAQEAGICFAGLVTVIDLATDQTQATPQGEMRASLGTALSALPNVLSVISRPGVCSCAATVG